MGNILSFMSMVSWIIIDSRDSLKKDIYTISRRTIPQCTNDFIISIDLLLKEQEDMTRRKIYGVMCSDDFLQKFPEFRNIMKLELSDFRRTVLFMLTLGMSVEDISKILLSNRESIMTVRSYLRRVHGEYFPMK